MLALPEGKEKRCLVYGPLLTITGCMLLSTQMRQCFVVYPRVVKKVTDLLEFSPGSLSIFKRIEERLTDGIKGHPVLFLPQLVTSFALYPSLCFFVILLTVSDQLSKLPRWY